MCRKEQLLAEIEVRFISIESSTPDKPAGMFVPVAGTPRCSPRLAAKCEQHQSNILVSSSYLSEKSKFIE